MKHLNFPQKFLKQKSISLVLFSAAKGEWSVVFMILQTAQHTRSSQSVVMTAVVTANTDSAASALQCRLCLFVSGLVTKNGSELTPSSLTSQHFMTFSQFYIISDRSVEVAPSRISSIHSSVQCGASVPVVVPVQTPEPECTHRINQLLADWCPIVQCNMNVMLEWLINVFDVPYQKS